MAQIREEWGDNFIPVIPSADPTVHTPETPNCSDSACPCNKKKQPIAIGNSFIYATSIDFVNGFQAGHLSFMSEKLAEPFTDEDLVEVWMDKLEDMQVSSLYGVGFAVGWLTTLARKGMARA